MYFAFYRLEHIPVGQETHEEGTAAAHATYITRPKACEDIDAINFTMHRLAFRREAKEVQDSYTRKNGRLCDKITICLPREFTHDQAKQAIHAFMWKISGHGRARVFAAYHEIGGENPHVHIYFVDRDIRTGRRVFGTTKRGSVDRLRALWAEVGTIYLQRFGYEAVLDHRSNLERGKEPPQPRRAPTYANDNEPSKTLCEPEKYSMQKHQSGTALSQPAPTRPIQTVSIPPEEGQSQPSKHNPEQEQEMLDQSALDAQPIVTNDEPESTANTITLLLYTHDSHLHAKAALAKLHEYNDECRQYIEGPARAEGYVTKLNAELEKALKIAVDADASLSLYKNRYGRLKGFKIGPWVSTKRRIALTAQASLSTALTRIDRINNRLDFWKKEWAEYDRSGNDTMAKREYLKGKIAEHMRINGTEQEIASALAMFKDSINRQAEKLTPAELDRAFKAKEIDELAHAKAKTIVMDLQRERVREMSQGAEAGY